MSVVRRITLPRSATSRADRIRPARPATHSVRRLPQSERTAPSPPPTVCPHPALRRTWPVWKVRVKTISARRALVMLTALIVCTGFWIICAGFWRHITAPPERVAAPHSGGVRPLTPLPPWERAFVQIPSPNWDLRPPGTRVSALVLHATASASGQVAINTFQDPASQRSAHFLLDRNGVIIEMVSPEHRAWHAGRSMLAGVPDANNFSVGVEMVDRNDGQPYTDAQYAALVSLIRRLRTHYNIPDARIVSHRSVALPAGRKSDPVGFDFARLYAALRH